MFLPSWSPLAQHPWIDFLAILVGLVVLTHWLQPTPGAGPAAVPGWQVIRPPHEVSALAIDGDVVWAGGRDGVVALDRATGAITSELRCDSPFEFVRALLKRADGSLWIGHDRGLTRWDGTSCATFAMADGLPDPRVTALAEDPRGRMWAGTWRGAAVLNDGLWQPLLAGDGLLDAMVNVIMVDRGEGVWFGSYVAPRGGLSYLRAGRWQYFTTDVGLPHNNVTSLLQDRQGDVWVGTGFFDRGGGVRLAHDGEIWRIQQTLTQGDGLAGAKLRSVLEDRRGYMWLGSEDNGLAVFAPGDGLVRHAREGLAHPEVKVIQEDEDGQLWLASLDGVTRVSAEAAAALTGVEQ